jgi:hypothetical protein
MQSALRGRDIKQNKLWIDLFVQKPDARGDAVNLVDLVCDALKKAAGVDDRWFSIRHLDWEIVKVNPQIFVGLGQEEVSDVQACSCCGRLLTFDAFGKRKSNKSGIGRVCYECRRSVDRGAA